MPRSPSPLTHIVHPAPQCNFSAAINCKSAVNSPWSSFGGIPTSLLGLAFYVGTAVVLHSTSATRLADEEYLKMHPAFRSTGILLSVVLVGALYSVALLLISVFIMQSLCPGCAITYICNFVAVFAARALHGGRSPFETLKTQVVNLGRALRHFLTVRFLLSVSVTVIIGKLWLQAAMSEVRNFTDLEMGM